MAGSKTPVTETTRQRAKREVCDILVRNGYVITLDARRTIYPCGAVAISGNSVVAVGTERDIVPQFLPRFVLDARGGSVHPGFIDAHYHTTIHLARGVVSDDPNARSPVTYHDWFNAIGDEDEYASTLASCFEMIGHGYTTFMEPGSAFEPDAVAAAAESVGIRASLADPFLWDVEQSDAMPPSGFKRAPCNPKRARDLLGKELRRNKNPNSLIRGHISLHGLGTASEELLMAAKACADENQVVLSQHHNFTLEEAEKNDASFGGRHSLVHFAEIGLLDRNCTFAHMNVIREDEVQPIVDSGMSVVWVPGNYQFYGIASKIRTRIPELLKRGVNVSFGVDTAKVWTFGEMEFFGYLVARHWGDYISPEGLLEMRTIGGAKSLGLENLIGTIEPGKRADLVIRTNRLPEAQPGVNVVQELMLVSRSHSVDTVLIDGQIVFKNGHSTRIDEDFVYDLARATTRRIMGRLGFTLETRWPTVG